MMPLLGVLLALWASFVVIFVPLGIRPTTRDFWLMALVYRLPALIVAWSLYLPVFRRLPSVSWWLLSTIGMLLTPAPFALLLLADSAIRGEPQSPGMSDNTYTALAGFSYCLFGLFLGAWVGFARRWEDRPR